MSSIFNCVAYDDIDSTIRLDGNVVYLALEDAQKSSAIHLTFNPFQVRTLSKYFCPSLSLKSTSLT